MACGGPKRLLMATSEDGEVPTEPPQASEVPAVEQDLVDLDQPEDRSELERIAGAETGRIPGSAADSSPSMPRWT
jgi:hypothetical protein